MGETGEKIDFTTKCRLCLSQNDELIKLYPKNNFRQSSNKILEIIERFTTIKIRPKDRLPQKICVNCIQTIQTMQTFQNNCKRNDEELRRMLASLTESKDRVESNSVIETSNDCLTADILQVDASESSDDCNDESISQDEDLATDANESTNVEDKSKVSDHAKASKKLLIACHICGKLFTKYNLKFHMNTHDGIRPYECNVDNCTSTFISPQHLSHHKRACHNAAPITCDVCGRAFKRKQALDFHRSYHFDASIPCDICEKLFKNRVSLKKHMVVHSQERKFKCEICDKAFQTRYTLRIHKRVHTQEKPYSCDCGVSFAYKCLLKAHTEKYHKETRLQPS